MTERYSEFNNFTSEELAADESFQAYVFRTNEADRLFWENFVALNPAKKPDIDEATELLTLLSFKHHKLSAQSKSAEVNRLMSTVSEHDRKARALAFSRSASVKDDPKGFFGAELLSRRWFKIAASLAGLLFLLSAAFYMAKDRLSGDGQLVYETAYGENTTFHLPDSSVVTLNGNSRLTLRDRWSDRKTREVWLDGEAFFEVKNKGDQGSASFIVHTPGMDVEVLGTSFNVFNREDKANVILNSGKVAVKIATQHDTSSMVMVPDEAIEFFRKDHIVTKRQVKAEVLTSWRNKVWIFENTPLYQIGEMIENTFGLRVTFSDDVDANEALAGTIPSENLEVLLAVLAKSSNLTITRNHNEILIDKTDPVSTTY